MINDERIKSINGMSLEELVESLARSLEWIREFEKDLEQIAEKIAHHEEMVVDLKNKTARYNSRIEIERAFYAVCFAELKPRMAEPKKD